MGGPLGRNLKRILLDHGCFFVRHGKGDHEICLRPVRGLNFAVDAGTRERFTANALLKQGGSGIASEKPCGLASTASQGVCLPSNILGRCV